MSYVAGSSGNVAGGSGTVTTLSLTLPAAVPSGAAICVAFGGVPPGAPHIGAITDNVGGNTYSNVDFLSAASFALSTFYGVNVLGGPTVITWTSDTGYTFTELIVDVFTNIVLASALDGHSINVQTSPGTGVDAVTSGVLTTTSSGDLLWSACIDIASFGMSVGTGLTQAQYFINTYMTAYNLSVNSGANAGTFTAVHGVGGDSFLTGALALRSIAGPPPNPPAAGYNHSGVIIT
jgi:hypothetical protein